MKDRRCDLCLLRPEYLSWETLSLFAKKNYLEKIYLVQVEHGCFTRRHQNQSGKSIYVTI